MAYARRPLRLQEIAQIVDIPQSTVSRFLVPLMMSGYVMQNSETLKYQLTTKLSHIGELIRAQFNIRDVCRPYLYALSKDAKETAYISVEENMLVVCLDTVDAPMTSGAPLAQAPLYTGRTDSMHATAAGKILLLNYHAEQLEQYFASRGLSRKTEKTITSKERFLLTLAQTRKDGYAISDEENTEGYRSIAAPVYDYDGKVIAALGIIGTANHMNYQDIQVKKEAVLDASARFSSSLGYRPEQS